MKKKICIYVFVLLMCPILSYAQSTVSGTVYLDSDDEVAPSATIRVKGTNNAVLTDLNGAYSIEANSGDVIVASYVGYATQEKEFDGSSSIDFLLENSVTLDDVVVVGFNRQKSEEALGYAVSEVSAAQIQESNQNNIVDALQGNTTGVLISQTGGGPGQTSRIVIRGIGSFSADDQPLFVIDGIPMSNNSLTVGGGGGRNISNRAIDINPNDVESVSVLKGGAATAIYGARAADGAVIITTKSGKSGKSRIDFSTSYGSERINKHPEVQKTYTQGYGGVYNPESFWPTWGPTVEEARAIDPSHPTSLFNNFEHAYRKGDNFRANLSFQGGSDNARIFVSGGYLDQNGTIPFSDFKRINAKLKGDVDISERLNVGANLELINSGGHRVDPDRFNTRLVYWAPAKDVTNYEKPDGTMQPYRTSAGNNPIYGAKTNTFEDDVNRIIASATTKYDFTDWISLNYRLSIDHYSDFRVAKAPAPRGLDGEVIFEDNGLGFVQETPIDNTWLNSNLYLSLTRQFNNNIGMDFIAGTESYSTEYKRITTRGDELDVWNLFSLTNAKNITTDDYKSLQRVVGIYGDMQLDWNRIVFLGLTARNDWNSTLPSDDRSAFYPSASLSYVISESFDFPEYFDYMKLRTSYASTSRSLSPYLTSLTFSSDGSFPLTNTLGNQVTGWSRQNSKPAPDLKPEQLRTFDIGTDIELFNRRMGVDFTWYKSNSKDIITPIPVTTSTGYSSFSGNAGEIENRGVELGLSGTPVQKEDYDLNMQVNFTKNNGKVKDIREGVESFAYGSWYGYSGSTAYMNFQPGLEYGNISGSTYKRLGDEDDIYVDKSKPIVIGDDGFPVRGDQKIIGNSQPDWFGSLNTAFRYKDFTFSFLIDTRHGSMKYNQQGNFFSAFGISPFTTNRNESIVFDGVLEDGSPNTKEVWLGQGVGPDGNDYGAGYYRNTYRRITENFVEDADWWRLRTFNISYALPDGILDKYVRDMSITLTGNNMWLSTDYSGFDPEAIGPGNSKADGFGGFTYPNSKGMTIRLNITPN